MTIIKVINVFSIVAGIFGALLCVNFAAEDFCMGHVGHGVICSACAAGCLFCAWFAQRIVEFVKSIEEEDEDED